MRIDDIRVTGVGHAFHVDVCIVGTGPVGLTLAAELAGSGLDVLVLESGGRTRDGWADRLNAIENVGAPRVIDQTLVRNRALGGSSNTWSGRVAALDEADFERRPWVPNSGWPIPRDEMARFLPRTLDHLGSPIADNVDPSTLATALGSAAGRYDPSLLVDYVWTYSRSPSRRGNPIPADYLRFGTVAAAAAMPGVRCVVNATVTHVDTTADGSAVTGLEVRGPDGLVRRVVATATVLCAGGIENARLLLASDRIVRGGVGNARDQVGRYLMDHPRGVVASVEPDDIDEVQRVFGSRRLIIEGRPATVMRGAAPSRAMQARDGLLNCAVWFNGEPAHGDPYKTLGRLARLKGKVAADAATLAREAPFVAAGIAGLVARGRTPPRRLECLDLLAMVEQAPDPDSRVTLGSGTDAFGMPLSRVDWQVSDTEKRTVLATTRAFLSECARLGLPSPRMAPGLDDGSVPLGFPDVAHPMGTTRMSSDPSTGVVDADCAVHGVRGLYAAGTSVFATGGHANPTQTALALAIRLADHLKARLATRAAPAPGLPAPDDAASVEAPSAPVDGRRRVLVTGATGGIGSKVVDLLLRRGYVVRALTSRMRPAEAAPSDVEWVVRDLRREDCDFRREVSGCDAILHLGAEMSHVEDMPRANGQATGGLARAAEAVGVGFMCYVSSCAVYGSVAGRVAREDGRTVTPDRDVPAENIANGWLRSYARSKLMGERALAEAAGSVEYVVFRPTAVVDVPDVEAALGWGRAKRLLQSRRNAHHVYVLDVAEALVWAMERSFARGVPEPGVTTYNLADETVADPTFAGLFAEAKAGLGPDAAKPGRALPGIVDWTVGYLRHGRGAPPRPTMPFMRFPVDRLRAAGFEPPHGMRKVRQAAVDAFADRTGRGQGGSGPHAG